MKGNIMIRSMNRFRLLAASLAAVVVAVAAVRAGQSPQSAGRPTITTAADFQRALKEVSNWGRWEKTMSLGART
jgi:hypothetical protein